MTRHRSPRGRGAPHEQLRRHRHEAQTVPFVVPAGASRGAARHRTAGRSALRRGAVAAGVTGGALAVAGAALPTLSLAAFDAPEQNALALTSEAPATSSGSAGVTPAAAAGAPVGAASADLIKAVDRERRAEAARVAETRAARERDAAEKAAAAAREAEKQRTASLDCGVSDTYDGVADPVQEVGNAMECVFPGHQVLGVGSRGGQSDHPGGYALDFMTDSGAGSGNTIADCVMSNADALGVSYVIWNQRINTGSGWESMEDRGGRTANHEDHVHISFDRGGSPDIAALRGCGGGGSGDKA